MLQEKTRVVDVVREKTRADIAREIRIQEAEKKKAESIASQRRVSMTGSITWNSKKQGVDQADFICNRHPKFLSGFEI